MLVAVAISYSIHNCYYYCCLKAASHDFRQLVFTSPKVHLQLDWVVFYFIVSMNFLWGVGAPSCIHTRK